jgi:hypothetical protein
MDTNVALMVVVSGDRVDDVVACKDIVPRRHQELLQQLKAF